MNAIIVELDEFKICEYIHYGRKIVRNCSKLGLNYQILTNSSKVIFGYENTYIFSNINLYSAEFISTLITHSSQ